ncbi:uncharacterized protein LOC127853972 isoform X2 [Dreissena polymorpha]|nr:uncharacterized protein LOC127853972 isoform X2 [Dreissena polymorpha]XP_052244827.1 uncharacterized protein LOC127853972 isoform X2 [Dreissena polymorpha]
MKVAETLSIFACIFLVTWSAGDGAPQWRPQGRFGKRFSGPSNIISALQSGTLSSVPNSNDQLQALFMDESDQDTEDTPTLEDFINVNGKSDISSMTSSRWPFASGRVCIETVITGVFRCQRRGRTDSTVVTLADQ